MTVFVAVTSANPRRRKHVELLNTLSWRTVIASEIVADEDSNVQRSSRMKGRVVGSSCAQRMPLLPRNWQSESATFAPFSTRTWPVKSENAALKTPPSMSMIGGKTAGACRTMRWAACP